MVTKPCVERSERSRDSAREAEAESVQMNRRLATLTVIGLAACGGGAGGDPDAPPVVDTSPPPDAALPDAAPCPSIDMCGWLLDYQQDIVGRLSGEREITPGVTVTRRASMADRTTVRQFLFDELARLGYAPELHAYSASGGNVLATLPATTGSGDALVIGAHFDGIPTSPAAADNATGTAIVLAMARYLRTVTPRTRPIRFALFDQEEIGLVGSEAYAMKLVADGTPVAAVHNFDMVSFDGDADRAIELWSPTPSLVVEYQNVASPLGIPVQPVAFQFSDHQSFLDAGFVTAGISEEYVGGDATEHYHTPTDTYDKINFTYLGMVTGVAVNVVAAAAAAP
jgi:hypothetical protein